MVLDQEPPQWPAGHSRFGSVAADIIDQRWQRKRRQA